MQTPPLTLTVSKDQAICTAAEKMIAAEPACRAFDSFACRRPDALKFRPLASDQYGYTEVALAPEIPSASYTIVYLQRFRGDQIPRLVETWKIDSTQLQEVFALPPGIISFEDRYQFYPGAKSELPADTNAKEFRALLQSSEKLSDEWSATADLLGQPHAVVRECAGAWLYGAYYRCDRVTKLTFLKVAADSKAERSCEFALVEKK
jgi:hypothetical protein